MSSIPILPTTLDWPSTIGNFLLNFGTLEYLTFVFLKDNLPPEEFVSLRAKPLYERLNRMAGHLPTEEQTAFAQLRERLEPIRQLRNHIAHGHMYASFDPETKKPRVTVLKAKDVDTGLDPDSEHVEFAELVTALTTLPSLIEEFTRLAGFGEPSPAAQT